MTMVNDRVNIAKRLRKTPEELAKENFYDDASYKIEPLLFEMVYEIVCGSDEHDVFLPLFDRLAMLIDPVTNVVVETNEDDVEYIFCGGCGEEFSTDLFNEHEITHCPYCGCRFRNPRQN